MISRQLTVFTNSLVHGEGEQGGDHGHASRGPVLGRGALWYMHVYVVILEERVGWLALADEALGKCGWGRKRRGT